MTKPRKNAPALYELMGTRPRLTPPGPEREEEPVVEYEPEAPFDEDQARTILGPGRTVRMPVGYFFFGLAIMIGIGVGGYMLGYKMRDRAYEHQHKQAAQAEIPDEPLNRGSQARPVNRALLGAPTEVPARQPGARPAPADEVSTPSGGTGRVILVESGVADPRVRGSNYAIVASLGKDRAEDLARFLADRGLEVAVLRLNNARLYSVVPLRGFPTGTFGSDERRQFDAALRQIGPEYEGLGGGRKSFDDLYWDKF